jgi:S-DNA-T family DNA segregation ATPase FtsK/SpoIIIE
MLDKKDSYQKLNLNNSTNSYKREITGVILTAMLLFLTLSCLTYSPNDNSILHFSSSVNTINNWCGAIGAQISAFLFYLFGLSSYILLTALIVFIISLFRTSSEIRTKSKLFSTLLIFISSASLATIYKLNIGDAKGGGLTGYYLARWITFALGNTGGLIILFATLWVGICVLFRVPLIPFFIFISKWLWYKLSQGVTLSYKKTKKFFKEIFTRNKKDKQESISQEQEEKDQKTQEEIYWASLLEKDKNSQEINNSNFLQENLELFTQEKVTGATLEGYALPDTNIFEIHSKPENKFQEQEIINRGQKLEEKLLSFGIKGRVVSIKTGPLITLFEYTPEIDSKISKIIALEDDLAMALETTSLRIIAPIPGKSAVGFEIANSSRQDVFFKDLIENNNLENSKALLPLALGVDVIGTPIISDLTTMPHLLVGGATGSGKSVALHNMIVSLLCSKTPQELSLILIDPKRLEFSSYTDIPHLIFPIVTEPNRANKVLGWVVHEMEERYKKMAQWGVRNISEYTGPDKVPYLVVIIDELADLMMVAGRECEGYIVRIAQMARAAGIHMIIATQRPSVDVVTGLIKVNFPSRIAFRVSSKIDSRTILDAQGAEKLLGKGDMLYMMSSCPDLKRLHGAYLSNKEIDLVTQWCKNQQSVNYQELPTVTSDIFIDQDDAIDNELYQKVCDFIKQNDEVSISLLQRNFRIGFNRSARIIDKLELDGLISPAQGSKPRKVLR